MDSDSRILQHTLGQVANVHIDDPSPISSKVLSDCIGIQQVVYHVWNFGLAGKAMRSTKTTFKEVNQPIVIEAG